MSWIYLIVASIFEIGWTFCLKFMSVKRVRTIGWSSFLRRENLEILAPFAGYIVFGIGNIIFFSLAMKQIPASVALAGWMGLTLIGIKMTEIYYFKQPSNYYQFIYMVLILVGIVGLKRTT
ncbi:MAG TPA: SMR family transporter [Puia sp.]|nr:SMR family transporter [Puia sp.]